MQVHVNAVAVAVAVVVAVAEDIDVAAAAAVEDIAPSSWDEEDNTQDDHDAFDDAEVEEVVVVVHHHTVTCVDNVAFHTLAQQQVEGMDIHDGHVVVAEEEEGDEDASFDDEDDRSAMVHDRGEDNDQASGDAVGEVGNDEASVGVDVAAALVDHRDSLVEKLHQDALAVVAVAADMTASPVGMVPPPFQEICHSHH